MRGGFEADEAPRDTEAGLSSGEAARHAELARIEAALFLARNPLPARKLAQLADIPGAKKTDKLVVRLNALYDQQGCAFRVVSVAGGYQLRTRPEFATWLQRLHRTPLDVRLSPPALETLAVVAYRQPILRAEIEAIRGVQCGEILRQLMERGLVQVVGRSEDLGRPYLYGTTRYFLEVFGLRDLDELPFPEYRKEFADESGEPPDRTDRIGADEQVDGDA